MNDEIKNLKEALQFSPNNIPLRMHLARTLYKFGEYQEAESELKRVIESAPGNNPAKELLAKLFYRKEEYSTTIVILEELKNNGSISGESLVLLAKSLLNEGSIKSASECYQEALIINQNLADEELDERFRAKHVDGEGGDDESIDEDAVKMIERPKIDFDAVGGMNHVKKEIELKIIKPLQHPELYEAYGKKIGGGILLYGPPGCGKTHLARATAGEVKAKFINVGINDILDMWIGNSEKNLHGVFEMARRNKPCVLFFDEVDALGASRSDMRQSAGRHLINQFLSELDGAQHDNEGILVLGATNAPWHLDPAFRRPGRFDMSFKFYIKNKFYFNK